MPCHLVYGGMLRLCSATARPALALCVHYAGAPVADFTEALALSPAVPLSGGLHDFYCQLRIGAVRMLAGSSKMNLFQARIAHHLRNVASAQPT